MPVNVQSRFFVLGHYCSWSFVLLSLVLTPLWLNRPQRRLRVAVPLPRRGRASARNPCIPLLSGRSPACLQLGIQPDA